METILETYLLIGIVAAMIGYACMKATPAGDPFMDIMKADSDKHPLSMGCFWAAVTIFWPLLFLPTSFKEPQVCIKHAQKFNGMPVALVPEHKCEVCARATK